MAGKVEVEGFNKLLEAVSKLTNTIRNSERMNVGGGAQQGTAGVDVTPAPFILSYPFDGTRASIEAGTTIFNFNSGTVKSPAGVISHMSTSLSKKGLEFMRSLVVNTDMAVVVQVGNGDKVPIRAGAWLLEEEVVFDKVFITATATTNIFVSASTAKKAPVRVSGGVSDSAVSTIADGRKTVTVAGTAEPLSATSVACKKILITAETDNTDIVVVGSSTVVAALATRRGIPLYPGDPVAFGIDDVADVYIDSLVDGEGVTFIYTN